MCDNETSELALRIKPSSAHLASSDASYNFSTTSSPMASQVSPAVLAEYQQRMQLYDYAAQAAVRFRLSQHPTFGGPTPYHGLTGHPALAENAASFGHTLSPFSRYDPRFRFMHEEPKPQHSYIGLIAMAILSSADHKMVLSDIYQHILDHYPYFRNRGPGWRNSIRHNLSLNDCFVKAGRSANGKGHYWAIHPANVEDFKKGDFRRRKAQRKVRKHMGLSVPDDEDSQSPVPTPGPTSFGSSGSTNSHPMHVPLHAPQLCANLASLQEMCLPLGPFAGHPRPDKGQMNCQRELVAPFNSIIRPAGKRLFDVESLLAPDSSATLLEKSNNREELRAQRSGRAPGQVSRVSDSPHGSPKGDAIGSNCSSPSAASSGIISPPPGTPELSRGQHSDLTQPCGFGAAANPAFPGLATWQAAQIQSLHNLQQINASLVASHSLRTSTNNSFSAWAAMSSFANPQAAANLFSYASLASNASEMSNPPRTGGNQK